jgi:recombinational DNA repair protein RecR
LQLYPSSLAVLIESLKKLPGIGAKTAQRLAIHLLHAPKGEETTEETTESQGEAVQDETEKGSEQNEEQAGSQEISDGER